MLLERALPLAGEPVERAEIDCWRALIEINVGVPGGRLRAAVRSAPRRWRRWTASAGSTCCASRAWRRATPATRRRSPRSPTWRRACPPADTPVGRSSRASCAAPGRSSPRTSRPPRRPARRARARRRGRRRGVLPPARGPADRRRGRAVPGRRRRRAAAQPAAGGVRPRHGRADAAHPGGAAAGADADPERPVDGGERRARRGHPAGQADRPAPGHRPHGVRARAARRAPRRRGGVPLAGRGQLRARARCGGWSTSPTRRAGRSLALELGRGRPRRRSSTRARSRRCRSCCGRPGPDRGGRARRRDRTARAWLTTLAAWAESSGVPWALAAAQHGRALLCADDEEAEQAFAAALDLHRRSRPFDRARTELAFGEYLRRARRRVEAREHLRAALDGFEALGAAAWAESARAGLRASGETARRRDFEHAGRAHGPGAPDRPLRRRRAEQPRRRRPAVPQPAHDRLPPAQRLPQARHQLADRARAARPRARAPSVQV